MILELKNIEKTLARKRFLPEFHSRQKGEAFGLLGSVGQKNLTFTYSKKQPSFETRTFMMS